MAAAQLLKVANTIDNKVGGIADNVLAVDNKMAGIDERVAGVDERLAVVDERVEGVDERVAGVDERVAGVNDRVACVDDRVKYVDDKLRAVGDNVDQVKRSCFQNRVHVGHAGSIILAGSQLRQDLRRWLSPPDPSTNHNIAYSAHHKGTATWFFEGTSYNEWKSTGSESLLWIHGKRAHLSYSAARCQLITILI